MKQLLLVCWFCLLVAGARMFRVKVGKSPCPRAWVWANESQSCFLMGTGPFTWHQSDSYCSFLDSTLVDMNDPVVDGFIRNEMLPPNTVHEYWVARSNSEASSGKCPYVSNRFSLVTRDECQDGTYRGYLCETPATKDCPQNCPQVCIVDGADTRCGCLDGYQYLAKDDTCVDIDECQTTNRCDQTCINTDGYYRCDCRHGYSLDGDNICLAVIDSPRSLGVPASSTMTAVAVAVPIITLVVFIIITIRLRVLNERAKSEIRSFEGAKTLMTQEMMSLFDLKDSQWRRCPTDNNCQLPDNNCQLPDNNCQLPDGESAL